MAWRMLMRRCPSRSMTIVGATIGKVPARAWTPAYDSDGQVGDGAWVAELTGLLA